MFAKAPYLKTAINKFKGVVSYSHLKTVVAKKTIDSGCGCDTPDTLKGAKIWNRRVLWQSLDHRHNPKLGWS